MGGPRRHEDDEVVDSEESAEQDSGPVSDVQRDATPAEDVDKDESENPRGWDFDPEC